jgi:predicted DsbA family dithiol-disulfide isomerase
MQGHRTTKGESLLVNPERVKLHIQVYSDIICPWCYVGLKRLEAALALIERPSDLTVQWRPFELNPTMPSPGMDRNTYLEAKFGSAEAVASMLDHVRQAGRESGIAFAFERIPKTPNTFEAHRLVWLAGREGRQAAMVERLFRGYFEEGMDLSQRATLVQLATEAGIDPQTAGAWLASQEGIHAVRGEEQAGLELGIRAVPYFYIVGHAGLSGAQPPPVIADWLRQALHADTHCTTEAG